MHAHTATSIHVSCRYHCVDSASKYASFGFTEALAEEMREVGATGVYITTVCPMFADTNMLRSMEERVVITDR